jgi:hypothetical protein
MSSIEIRITLLAATASLLLATTACAPSGTADETETEPTSDTSASPSADASESADANAPATVGGTFEFADGTTVGTLAEPWRVAGEAAGQLVHQVPGAPGANFDDATWADLIVYVPDAAYGPGATEPEAVPADPVAWTLSHPDLEILDQREVTVDGVTATQIDARAKTETGWLAVEAMPLGWGADERVVLVPLEGAWLVVRGSTFQPDVAFAEDLPPGDGFSVMLESVDLPD